MIFCRIGNSSWPKSLENILEKEDQNSTARFVLKSYFAFWIHKMVTKLWVSNWAIVFILRQITEGKHRTIAFLAVSFCHWSCFANKNIVQSLLDLPELCARRSHCRLFFNLNLLALLLGMSSRMKEVLISQNGKLCWRQNSMKKTKSSVFVDHLWNIGITHLRWPSPLDVLSTHENTQQQKVGRLVYCLLSVAVFTSESENGNVHQGCSCQQTYPLRMDVIAALGHNDQSLFFSPVFFRVLTSSFNVYSALLFCFLNSPLLNFRLSVCSA